MAAPVGHIFCALAMLNSGVNIPDSQAFLVGNSWPDSRYPLGMNRKTTHSLKDEKISSILNAPTSFEAGREFHVLVDLVRERHMKENDAYRFVKDEAWPTQILKLVEDNILFDKLKGRFDAKNTFNRIYDEERAYGVSERDITSWHKLLATYLDQNYWFNITRYYASLKQYREGFGLPAGFFQGLWQSLKTFAFIGYAYWQIERLSKNPELRSIILDFYEHKFEALIAQREKVQVLPKNQ